ncbi:MAG TPA: metallophosphoesterase [Anaerolineales bacterium]|nr:metallophosphoesterase [Anaerolineales bacterium]
MSTAWGGELHLEFVMSRRYSLLLRLTRYLLMSLGALVLLMIAAFLWWIVLPQLSSIPRGPYLQSVTPDSIWIVWDTRRPGMGRVEFGTTPSLGNVVEEDRPSTHHVLQLTGLQPYSMYYYQVDGGRKARFRTAAGVEQDSFRFVVFGDTRENPFVHRAIINRIRDTNPDFVLHTGDLVESGPCNACWDEFFRIEAPLLRTTPFYPTLGNHEDDQSPIGGTHYFDIFHLPGNERWYAFDYGNARFISLKADGYPLNLYYPQQEQLDWLETQLAENDKTWTFVFFHWGVYTARGEDFLETGMRSRLVPLFERYGVRAVFMGHNHGYERVLANDITYITTAGGGAGLYELRQAEPGSQMEARAYHFVLLEMNGEDLTGQVIDRRGKVIDRFELQVR